MSSKLKGILIGIVIGTIICASTTFALNGTMQKTLSYSDIKIYIDGNKITPTDANGNYVEPFIIDGTTYLPVRAIGNAFGKEVFWDGNTHTVYIGQKPELAYMDAFAKNIKDVINEYGKYVNKEGMGIRGLKYGTLIDFEKDSIPELVLVRDWTVEVYRFDGEQSSKIFEEKAGSRYMQTDVSYTIGINTSLPEPIIITYQSPEEWRSEKLHVFTLKNGKPNIQVLYAEGSVFNKETGYLDNGFDTFMIDEATVSKDTYMTLRNNIFNGEKEVDVCWNNPSGMPANYIYATDKELDTFLEQFGF